MDVTYLLTDTQALAVIYKLDLHEFDYVSIRLDDDYVTLTISDDGVERCLYVEGVRNENGVHIYHETDVILMSEDLPSIIAVPFLENCEYEFLGLISV